jgi:hypothetical protein
MNTVVNTVLNESALETNRSGRLTPSQMFSFFPMILMGGVFFLMGSGFAFATIYSLFQQTSMAGALMSIITFGGLSLALLWVGYLVAGKRIIDIVIGQVRYVDGSGTRGNYHSRNTSSTYHSSGGTTYLYVVGETQFQISRKLYNSLPDWAKKVRAYYAPLSKALVNVEVLDQSENNAAALEIAKRHNANLAGASEEVRKSLDETKAMLAQLQQQTNDLKKQVEEKKRKRS